MSCRTLPGTTRGYQKFQTSGISLLPEPWHAMLQWLVPQINGISPKTPASSCISSYRVSRYIMKKSLVQEEFQGPKMEVLYHVWGYSLTLALCMVDTSNRSIPRLFQLWLGIPSGNPTGLGIDVPFGGFWTSPSAISVGNFLSPIVGWCETLDIYQPLYHAATRVLKDSRAPTKVLQPIPW